VVIDMGGETPFRGVQGWSLGNGPADEHAVHFQAEVVMESRCPVLLDDEAVLAGGLGGAFRLRRLTEIAFALVLGERTRHRIQFDRMVSMASTPRPSVHEPDMTVTQHLITHRRELHASPEMSFKETETAHYIAERLDALGVDKLTAGVGGNGVVAEIRGVRPERPVLVRT